ncbi:MULTISPECIES: hypothetical protein [Paenibacillus]|uniref:Plasmid segregation centromere-binding protein ParR n=2 Tax=Paenibacillus TaxID=44249 RepID=A0AAX3N0Y7_9BACL|nr:MULTISPECIES: hypothetical protein [Paenibacillus]NUU75087.1 hypothetical protein [Paenibacillus xylanilyticus]PAF31707.1 hypothetical protein CHI14_11235 [Paenibacillus sp. 7516]WDH83366.1 hypothetical protein PUW23_03730 [Paenibacillus urinalis]
MGNRNRLSISFKKEHQYIYDHLQGITNKSDYIARALEVFISGGGQSPVSKKEIKNMVLQILQEQGNAPQTLSAPPPEHQILEEDVELLSQLF